MLAARCHCAIVARRLAVTPASTVASGGSAGRDATETASHKVRAPDAGAADVTVQKARALRARLCREPGRDPSLSSQAAEMSGKGHGPPLEGLEGRAADAGLHAIATDADGREDLRAAASGAIQRGDSACVLPQQCITRSHHPDGGACVICLFPGSNPSRRSARDARASPSRAGWWRR
jgi:hypothetical protein